MHRSRLYSIVVIACLAGYAWIGFLQFNPGKEVQAETVCLIKNVTGVPCPSCGASRSVMSIIERDFLEAAVWNPLGYVLVALLLISPFWILADVLAGRDSFLHFYRNAEQIIRKKWIAIPMIVLLGANWIWNILKGL